MGYYNGKKVLSAVKVEPCLNLNEGGSVEDNTLFIDEYVGAITTINGVSYKHCVSKSEAQVLTNHQSLKLPTKQVYDNVAGGVPCIYKNINEFLLYYGLPIVGGNVVYLDTQSSGLITFQGTTTLSNAYLVNDNGNWVLFFNLINE